MGSVQLYQRCFIAKLNTSKAARPKAAPSASMPCAGELGTRSAPSGVLPHTSWCHLRLLLRSQPLWKPSGMGGKGGKKKNPQPRVQGSHLQRSSAALEAPQSTTVTRCRRRTLNNTSLD